MSANVKAGGMVSQGDPLVRAVWTGHNGTPASRWVANGDLSRTEDEALGAEMEQRFAERHRAEALAAVQAGAMTAPRDPRIVEMTDEQLFAAALGERVQ